MTFATSVLPTPAWPSMSSGFRSVIARCTLVATGASVTYCASSIICWIFRISSRIGRLLYPPRAPRHRASEVVRRVDVERHVDVERDAGDARGVALHDRLRAGVTRQRAQLGKDRCGEEDRGPL